MDPSLSLTVYNKGGASRRTPNMTFFYQNSQIFAKIQ